MTVKIQSKVKGADIFPTEPASDMME